MFGMGMQELMVVLMIGLIFFGGKRLPEIGKGLGRAIAAFKGGLAGGGHEEKI